MLCITSWLYNYNIIINNIPSYIWQGVKSMVQLKEIDKLSLTNLNTQLISDPNFIYRYPDIAQLLISDAGIHSGGIHTLWLVCIVMSRWMGVSY